MGEVHSTFYNVFDMTPICSLQRVSLDGYTSTFECSLRPGTRIMAKVDTTKSGNEKKAPHFLLSS